MWKCCSYFGIRWTFGQGLHHIRGSSSGKLFICKPVNLLRLHYLFDHSVAGTRFLQSSIIMFIFKATHILDLHQLLKKNIWNLIKNYFILIVGVKRYTIQKATARLLLIELTHREETGNCVKTTVWDLWNKGLRHETLVNKVPCLCTSTSRLGPGEVCSTSLWCCYL